MKTISNHNYILNLPVTKEDGKDYIEIGRNAETRLGKYLGYTYERRISLPYGVFSNVYKAISYLALVDFPDSLKLLHMTPDDVKLVRSLKQRKLTNYWVIVLYILIHKVRGDKTLRNMICETELDFHWYDGVKVTDGVTVHSSLTSMGNYTAVVRLVSNLTRAGKIYDDDIIDNMLDTAVGGNFKTHMETIIKEAS